MTWLDRSASSLKIAQARAAARGLTNIVWQQRSLLDLPGSGLGPFDYVDCCGVLHHLPDPAEGLRALLSVLAPGGGLGLMVYAPHGRTGVYMVQDALRLLAPADETPAARLDVAKRVMRHLPETAWLRRNGFLDDHVNGGDAGLYDLLLNPRDRAFTVHAAACAVGGRGTGGDLLGRADPLRPAAAVAGPATAGAHRGAGCDRARRAGRGTGGNINAHVVYCVRAAETVERADFMAEDAVPITRERPARISPMASSRTARSPCRARWAASAARVAAAGVGDPAPGRWQALGGRDRGGSGAARDRGGTVRARLAGDIHHAGAGQPVAAGGTGASE